jgi:hypothetical protein
VIPGNKKRMNHEGTKARSKAIAGDARVESLHVFVSSWFERSFGRSPE